MTCLSVGLLGDIAGSLSFTGEFAILLGVSLVALTVLAREVAES
jgi:hypothetical protein